VGRDNVAGLEDLVCVNLWHPVCCFARTGFVMSSCLEV
jgi:hypothetical protein